LDLAMIGNCTISALINARGRVERVLCDGPLMRRYEAPDDFGLPQTAFNVCAFWRVDALARIGRIEQARESFEALLAHRNPMGLLSEDLDPVGHLPADLFDGGDHPRRDAAFEAVEPGGVASAAPAFRRRAPCAVGSARRLPMPASRPMAPP
jgi:hypothetical protein